MAYNNYFPATYGGYNPNPYGGMQTYPQTVPPAQNSGIQWVQGEAGAKAFSIGAGQSVLLMDSESNAFYIKATDQSGMPLPLRVFDYTERTAQSVPTAPQTAQIDTSLFVTRAELDERLAALTAPTAAKKPTTKKQTEGE
ncbi:MAG: hypothetical protein IJ740_03300 [Ruminococcus sp.]|nr:hypothetical protein [Ruminococcus sp.]